MSAQPFVIPPQFPLPWDMGREDRRRFKRWLIVVGMAFLGFGLVIPWLQLPQVEREQLEQLPPQLARIQMDEPEPPPPPPPKPEEAKPELKQPDVKPEPKPEPVVEKPPEPKVDTVTQAREKAALSGLLAFKDAFADMRESVDTSKLQDTGAIRRGAGDAASIDRSVLTSKHATRSAGVNVAALSRDTGGVALSGRETTKVEAPEAAAAATATRSKQPVDERARSIEDIRRVFDSNKGAIFAIYNRALRQDPTLQGKVVLELVIDPSGRVIECNVKASELGDENLVAKIAKRIRLFDFGARDVRTTTISYPVHFLPS